MRDVILSTLEADSYGEAAKKKRAQRRMDMLDGNAKSYAKWLNSPDRMKQFTDYNALVALIGGIKSQKEEEKKKRKEKKTADEKEKERKKIETELKEQREKEQEMPGIRDVVSQGLQHVLSKTNREKKKILQYYFEESKSTVNNMKKAALDELLKEKMQNSNSPLEEQIETNYMNVDR